MELRSKEDVRALPKLGSQSISRSSDSELPRLPSETDAGRFRHKPAISETDDQSKKYPPNDSDLYTYITNGTMLIIELKEENKLESQNSAKKSSPSQLQREPNLISFDSF